MKKIIILLLSVICYYGHTFAQAPQGFQYQAVIRDANSNILPNQLVGIQIMIRQGSAGGVPVYLETFLPTTNQFGLVNLQIGSGTTVDQFNFIDWTQGPYFIEIAVDILGGTSFLVMGTTQLMSVPYAMHATTAVTALVDNVDDADADPTNELQTWDDLPNKPAGFADGVDNIADADADSTNEIQSLSVANGQLSISGSNTVAIPSVWQQQNTAVYTIGDSVGINTSNPIRPLHVMGSTTLSSVILTPNEPFSGDDASIILTEDDDDTYHMEMKYDGGDNRMYFYGKNNASVSGPHVGINRDNGRVGIGTGTNNPSTELEVVGTITATNYVGDGSALSNVYADSLRGSMQAEAGDLLEYNGASWVPKSSGRYAFHASASTDQTVGDTAYDTLRCNNSSSGENFEFPAGVYDNATFAFVAPKDGIYYFEAAVLWDNANLAETRNAIFIRINNTDEVGEWSASGGLDFFGTSVNSTVELNAGDEVRIRIYNGDNINAMDTFSQSGKYCYFSGYMLFEE